MKISKFSAAMTLFGTTLILATAYPAVAQKGGKKGGGNSGGYDRACATSRDAATDHLTSDGNGSYCDSGDGQLQVWADTTTSAFRLQTSLSPGNRGINLDMSNCVGGDCITPFDGQGKIGYTNAFLLGGHVGSGGPMPDPGIEQQVGGLHLWLYESGTLRWILTFAGSSNVGPPAQGTEVKLRGADTDADGVSDNFTLEVAPTSPVIIEELIYTEGKGGKQELSEIVIRGQIYMPFQLTFQQTGSKY